MKAVGFRGSEAPSKLATQAFEMLVSNFDMPGTSRLEFLNKVRQGHHESVLALITAYVTKPFEMSLLVQFIHELIRRRHTRGGKESAARIVIPDPRGIADRP